MRTETLKVTGMTCGGCARKVSNALQAVLGVSDATVTFSAGVAEVKYDERITSAGQLEHAVISAGYGVGEANDANNEQPKDGCCG